MIPLAMRLAATDSGMLSDACPHAPTLGVLCDGLTVDSFVGDRQQSITCIVTDSRRVVPGALFFAIRGLRTDGNEYIDEAIDRGAVGIISELPTKVVSHVSYVVVSDVRRALAAVSKRFYEAPDEKLQIVGITGTNGKTTVAMLTQFLLSKASAGPTGLLGTVHYDLGKRTLPSYKTTPESVDTFGMLRQMVDEGCPRAVMEVSSHAVDQDRVYGMQMPVMTFLNLTQDHLDYHSSMEAYFSAKQKLFTGDTGNLPKVAVVNIADPYGKQLLTAIPETVRVVTFGAEETAMFRADDIELSAAGTSFNLMWPGGTAALQTRELGAYNVSNVLAALAICHAVGIAVNPLIEKLTLFPGVPGRMQRIEQGQPFNVLVDYAHTDDALRNALTMLREITTGRILVVFGCGGNRDRKKRVLMTTAVQELADVSWATSDNPRKESIEAIFADMQAGVSNAETIHFIKDRRRAISLALDAARPGDCVLIAGKGHETYQEFADTVVPFDDRMVAKELLTIKEFRPR